jgi:hypothetical protein
VGDDPEIGLLVDLGRVAGPQLVPAEEAVHTLVPGELALAHAGRQPCQM